MTPSNCTVIDHDWVSLDASRLLSDESYPFSLYPGTEQHTEPLARGGTRLTHEQIRLVKGRSVYFRRSMLSAYGRYLDGVFARTQAVPTLLESGRIALLSLFDDPCAPDKRLSCRRWAQRIVRISARVEWEQRAAFGAGAESGPDIAASSVRCALTMAVLGRWAQWSVDSHEDLSWAALIHALGRTLSTTHTPTEELQVLLPLVTSGAPISEHVHGALRYHRERLDGSGPERMFGDQIPLAARYLGLIIYLEETGILSPSLAETQRNLAQSEQILSGLFGQTVLERINGALSAQV